MRTEATDLTDRLYEFYHLQVGWFFGGGRPVPELAKMFVAWLKETRPEIFAASSVFPIPDGGLSFEWDEPEVTIKVQAEIIDLIDYSEPAMDHDEAFDGIREELLASIDRLFAKQRESA